MLVSTADRGFWINLSDGTSEPMEPTEPNKWASIEKPERLRLNLVERCCCFWTGLALAAPIGNQPQPIRGTARYPIRAKAPLSLCGRVIDIHGWMASQRLVKKSWP